ncbi:hypothetical protein HAX54_040556 [Datura stramonium]|uniref:Uncharacterized protein n=1 Tax=Datura stramonium TaxID=4076 RepID=A0ABS8SK71_DATST|nr:hypothetical protein [Datura stramonium]
MEVASTFLVESDKEGDVKMHEVVCDIVMPIASKDKGFMLFVPEKLPRFCKGDESFELPRLNKPDFHSSNVNPVEFLDLEFHLNPED